MTLTKSNSPPDDLMSLIEICNAIPASVQSFSDLSRIEGVTEDQDEARQWLSEKIILHTLVKFKSKPGFMFLNQLDRLGFNDEYESPIIVSLRSDQTLAVGLPMSICVLNETGISIKRLEECCVCFRLFWKRRLGTKYCPRPQCRETFHKRRLRRNQLFANWHATANRVTELAHQKRKRGLNSYSKKQIASDLREAMKEYDRVDRKLAKGNQINARRWLDDFQADLKKEV